MKHDLAKLTADIQAARTVAAQAIVGLEDGGTSNFDSLFIPTGRGCQFGRKSAKIQAALDAADGCSAFHAGYGWRKGYVVSVGLGGQGATRTKAVETVVAELKAAGWECSVWYQAD